MFHPLLELDKVVPNSLNAEIERKWLNVLTTATSFIDKLSVKGF